MVIGLKGEGPNTGALRHREKEAICAGFMDLRKRALEIQAIEIEAKLIAERTGSYLPT
jgi:hypothetical protein